VSVTGIVDRLMLIFLNFGSLEFQKVGEAVRDGAASGCTMSGCAVCTHTISLFIGATGKSAQIPFCMAS